MYTHETTHEAKALFVILMGAILFVFAQLPNSIVINMAFFTPTQDTPVEMVVVTPEEHTGWVQRTFPGIPEETWQDNVMVTLPKGNDIMTADWNDIECLAVNIYHEARGEPQLGQEMVAQVVVNRMKKKWWPETACGVVRQAYQFSWTHDGLSDQVVNTEAYKQAYLIAVEYLRLKKQADFPHADQIVNYHNSTVEPNWTNMDAVSAVGDHQFYRPAYYVTSA